MRTRKRVRRIAVPAALVLFGVLLLCPLVYRATFYVWPGQAAGSRIRWCGREYVRGNGAPRTLRQVLAMSSPEHPERIAGSYPPLWPSAQVVASQGDPYCPTVIHLSVGRNQYVGYALQGGP